MNLYRCTKCGIMVAVSGKPDGCPSCKNLTSGSHAGNPMERIRDPAEYFE